VQIPVYSLMIAAACSRIDTAIIFTFLTNNSYYDCLSLFSWAWQAP